MLAGPAGEAAAADHTVPVVAHVFYGDLNLGSPAGARSMWRRIGVAAMRACGPSRTDILPQSARDARRCRELVMARAVGSLNAPLVTAEFVKAYERAATETASR